MGDKSQKKIRESSKKNPKKHQNYATKQIGI